MCVEILSPEAHFSEVINLRSHMSMFTWKMNSFLSISLEIPYMCVETLRRGLVFLRWSIWGITCLCLLEKCTCFPCISFGNSHKCVLKPSAQGLFFWGDQFDGVTCLCLLWKMKQFPIYLLRNSYTCVLKASGLVFLIWLISGVTS